MRIGGNRLLKVPVEYSVEMKGKDQVLVIFNLNSIYYMLDTYIHNYIYIYI